MRKKGWASAYLGACELIETGNGDWSGAFGRSAPLRVELGCGKGGFICQAAEAEAGVNFVALEADLNVLACAARLAEGRGLANVRFIHGFAEGIEGYFEGGGVERIYINFCDPWRNRAGWRKRRLTHRSFLERYRRVLAPGGGVWFKTDNRDLFMFSVGEFRECGWRVEGYTEDLAGSGFEGNIVTEYEERFMGEGKAIYRLEAYAR